MTTELFWTGNEDVEVFHDTKRNIEYHPSKRPHEVPDDAVEWYLTFEGWEPPDTEASEADEIGAEQFIDNSWQTVIAEVRNGAVDGMLEDVKQAELEREEGPRENSVLAAIERREEEIGEVEEDEETVEEGEAEEVVEPELVEE